ncbi:hypothetical protein JCM10908_004703 [Rhodotorula pacifica]|uniref:glycoside hydrolase family 16 protein n=1 Tax=Rhodotorula pacifica TaxID=1495444 RepID=UPI0031783E72
MVGFIAAGSVEAHGSHDRHHRHSQRHTTTRTCEDAPHVTSRPWPVTSKSTATLTSQSTTTSATSSTTSSKAPVASPSASAGPYKLTKEYSGANFFDGWQFFTEEDPTEGQVEYVSRSEAQQAGLISADANSITMRVDNRSKLGPGEKRKSVRIESTEPAEIGSLILADIVRMPWGCATWPAWWSYGVPDWPSGGEIDVIEGVNLDAKNIISLHTDGEGCAVPKKPDVRGAIIAENTQCDVQSGNGGCSYSGGRDSYGQTFNAGGGGVMATLFTEDEITIWFFARAQIPENVSSGAPDVSTWGKPTATWSKSSCDISRMFAAQRLIFNISLCGNYAGVADVWAQTCASKAATCSEYLMDPSHFDEAIWEVKSVKVYSV